MEIAMEVATCRGKEFFFLLSFETLVGRRWWAALGIDWRWIQHRRMAVRSVPCGVYLTILICESKSLVLFLKKIYLILDKNTFFFFFFTFTLSFQKGDFYKIKIKTFLSKSNQKLKNDQISKFEFSKYH